MDPRIKELAEQAKAESNQWLGSKPAITITYDELEKFAELIVRECIEVVKWTPSQFPNGECVKNIKEHFGVKE